MKRCVESRHTPTFNLFYKCLYYCGFDGINDVADVIVGDVGAGWETDADFEEGFGDAIDVCGSVFVDRLLVHRLPKGASFNVSFV